MSGIELPKRAGEESNQVQFTGQGEITETGLNAGELPYDSNAVTIHG